MGVFSKMKQVYCCVCERETSHREIDDDVFFEFALECLVCHTVWEAEVWEAEERDASRQK